MEGAAIYGEVTILFVNDRQIKALNNKYAGNDSPTDVLAFDCSDAKGHLCADIIVSVQTAVANARHYNSSPLYEVYLYVVHGLLHLLGYDDTSVATRKKMHQKATCLLRSLAIKASA